MTTPATPVARPVEPDINDWLHAREACFMAYLALLYGLTDLGEPANDTGIGALGG